jgi:hypothetical protein
MRSMCNIPTILPVLYCLYWRSLCAPSVVSCLGAWGSLDITFSNCDHKLSTWLNSLPTCRAQVSCPYAMALWNECTYCYHTLKTAVQPVHVLQHGFQARRDVAHEQFTLLFKVRLLV